MTVAQNIPGSPAQTTGGGGFWGGFNSTLQNALSVYKQYEEIRNAQPPQYTLAEKAYTVELPNGAGAVLEGSKLQPGEAANLAADKVDIAGVSLPKWAAIAGGAVLGLVALKKMGVI